MNNNEYTREDLTNDLTELIKLGLIDYELGDDGEWHYRISEKGRQITTEEAYRLVRNQIDENNSETE